MRHLKLPWGRMLATGAVAVALALGASAVPRASAATGTFTLTPAPISPAPVAGSDFTITVTANSASGIAGAQTDITFNRNLFQINAAGVTLGADFTPGPTWQQEYGATPGETLAQAITDANATGRLRNISSFDVSLPPGPAALAAGSHMFMTISFHTLPAYQGTYAAFGTVAPEMLDGAGNALTVSPGVTAAGTASVGGTASMPNLASGSGVTALAGRSSSSVEPWMIGLWVLVASVAGAGLIVVYRRVARRGVEA